METASDVRINHLLMSKPSWLCGQHEEVDVWLLPGALVESTHGNVSVQLGFGGLWVKATSQSKLQLSLALSLHSTYIFLGLLIPAVFMLRGIEKLMSGTGRQVELL